MPVLVDSPSIVEFGGFTPPSLSTVAVNTPDAKWFASDAFFARTRGKFVDRSRDINGNKFSSGVDKSIRDILSTIDATPPATKIFVDRTIGGSRKLHLVRRLTRFIGIAKRRVCSIII